MEAIVNEPGKVRGMEILYFEDAELKKVKGNHTSFATFGSLSVLYFKDYNRFVLHLNDWKYPLLSRLPVLGLDNEATDSRKYAFPALHGFAYILKINKKEGSFPFHNLDAVLDNNSRLSWKKHDQAFRKAEESPDDLIRRHVNKQNASAKDLITETLKHGIQNIKNKVETMKTGTKGVTSRKRRVHLNDIKTKNFKKDANSRLKKSYLKSHYKQTDLFWQARRGNLNNIVSRKFEDIMKYANGPYLYLWREELEEAILNNKDVGAQGLSSFNMALHKDEPMDLKFSESQMSTRPSSVTQSIVGQGPMEAHSKGENREIRTPNPHPEIEFNLEKINEALLHYQG